MNARREALYELTHPDRIPVPPNTVALFRFYRPEYNEAITEALRAAFGSDLTARADIPGTAGWIVVTQDPKED